MLSSTGTESRLFPLSIPQFFSSWGWTPLIDLILRLVHFCILQIILPALFQMSHIGTQCCHWSCTGAEWKFVGVSGYTHQCTPFSSIFSPPGSSTSPNWGLSVTVEPFLTYSTLSGKAALNPAWQVRRLWEPTELQDAIWTDDNCAVLITFYSLRQKSFNI